MDTLGEANSAHTHTDTHSHWHTNVLVQGHDKYKQQMTFFHPILLPRIDWPVQPGLVVRRQMTGEKNFLPSGERRRKTSPRQLSNDDLVVLLFNMQMSRQISLQLESRQASVVTCHFSLVTCHQ